MQESKYKITQKLNARFAYESRTARIVIPSDIDRDEYIAHCYKTSTVSIYSEHDGFQNRVPIDQYSLNFITFPESIKEFGGIVSYQTDPVRKRPMVTGYIQ